MCFKSLIELCCQYIVLLYEQPDSTKIDTIDSLKVNVREAVGETDNALKN